MTAKLWCFGESGNAYKAALTLAFNDTFRLMAFLFLAALVLVPFSKAVPVSGPPPDAH